MTTLALSYDEIAGRLGIAVASARRLVHRKKWPKGKGNDGRVIVQVPVEFCEGRDGPADRGGVAARLIEDREARLAEWRRRGREKGQEFAVETTRGMKAGGTAETWARALAAATVLLANEHGSAGATREELTAFVNELSASFGETIEASAAVVDLRPNSPRSRSTGVVVGSPSLMH